MAIAVEEWLGLIDKEYLQEFIPAGGSAVKFVVGGPDHLEQAELRVAELAGRHRLLHLSVDSASVRLHMVQDLFFCLSRQIDWEATVQRFVEALFQRQGHEWPTPGQGTTLHSVAEANDVDATILGRDVRRWLKKELMQDTRMASDLRNGLAQLCLRCFEPAGSGQAGELALVLQWLRGERPPPPLGPLRKLHISGRIGRHNARAMLRSLCRWLRLCGHAGLCVSLDIRQFAKTGPEVAEGSVRYSPAAVMDAYEVLRQLVDDAERMEGLLLLAKAGPEFVDGDPKRSIDAYVALKMRVWADVRATGRDNPLAPLIVLDGHSPALSR